MHRLTLVLGLLAATAATAVAQQDRAAKVRNDRKAFEDAKDWVYNNLDAGIKLARESGKPLFIVFRCIPCEACQQFDDDVARRDPVIRDLMDRFVCVRIVQANNIDLAHFQYDFDQSFAAFLTDADLTIYARFGTRSDRAEAQDISLQGLRKAMEATLRLHAQGARVKPMLAGKQVTPSRYATPLDYPSLASRFGKKLDYKGQVVKSCVHCHQVREAERLVHRAAGAAIPDEVLYPYPDPSIIGLTMDPAEMAKVERVAADSPAGRAGIEAGDAIEALGGQPLLSIADLQWVLHRTGAHAELPAKVRRGGSEKDVVLSLPDGWRRGNISWRASTWDLRRMGLGGMILVELTDDERRQAAIPDGRMALRIKFLGMFGEHANAKNAGLEKGDVIVAFDGQDRRMSESELIAYAVQQKRSGDKVAVTVVRNGARQSRTIGLR